MNDDISGVFDENELNRRARLTEKDYAMAILDVDMDVDVEENIWASI